MKEVALQPHEPFVRIKLPKHLQDVALATPLAKIEASQTTHMKTAPELTMIALEALHTQPAFSFQMKSAFGQLQDETPNFEIAKILALHRTQL
jgi:hypothetical protein